MAPWRAWNNYINSPQGSILKPKKGGEEGMELNPRRMMWREYFDRKNKGDLKTRRYDTATKTFVDE